MNSKQAHPFERTLGPGPYRLVGFFDLGRCIAALNAGNAAACNNGLASVPEGVAVGSCAHCGQGILNNYIVQSGDGRRHAVGSDCVAKVQLPAAELTKFQRMERARLKAQRDARKKNRANEARAVLAGMLEKEARLAILPHPSPYRAAQGATLRDYVEYCLKFSRDGGILLVLRTVRAALKEV